MNSDLFIFSGESSGDHLGSLLIQSLLKQNPALKIHAVAGPLMREQKITEVLAMEQFQVMGFTDVIKALPNLRKLFKKTIDLIFSLNPKVIVLIDYPGFNLRLAKKLKKLKCKAKIIQYVCPSVWAWKKGRIETMKSSLDHLLCLFPFEPSCFSHTNLKTTFIGHPLAQKIASYTYTPNVLESTKPILSIFPGSRKREIERNLPLLLEMAKNYAKNFSIVISSANEDTQSLILSELEKNLDSSTKVIPSKYNYELMKASFFSFAVSGTITLELAMHEVPSIVCYAISKLDLFIAQKIFRIKLPHYCIANYVADQRIYPEFYGPHFCKKKLDETLSTLLSDQIRLLSCKKGCQIIKEKLQKENPSLEAAKIILSHLG